MSDGFGSSTYTVNLRDGPLRLPYISPVKYAMSKGLPAGWVHHPAYVIIPSEIQWGEGPLVISIGTWTNWWFQLLWKIVRLDHHPNYWGK